MAFYIPEVVLALREMKKGNEGGGGGREQCLPPRREDTNMTETASTL